MHTESLQRRPNRLPLESYRARRWFFVTACVENRRGLLVGEFAHQLVACTRSTAERRGFAVYAFCVMPDHFHLLVYPTRKESDLISFVSGIKQVTGYQFRRDSGGKLWQKSFYDHVLREGEDIRAVAYYIWTNPVRSGLCADPRQWPGSGSFVVNWLKELVPPDEAWVPPWRRERIATPQV